jgi:hypothetical protein
MDEALGLTKINKNKLNMNKGVLMAKLFAFLALSLWMLPQAKAEVIPVDLAQAFTQLVQVTQVGHLDEARNFNWKKGDEAKYNIRLGGFGRGTMVMSVMDIVSEGVWIQQLVDLGFLGRQDIRQLIDPQTGEVKKTIVNGQEQAPDANSEIEVIETRDENVTVPAGTFYCMYIKLKITNSQGVTNSENWVNPRQVPVMGLVKMVAQTQVGALNAELTSFKKN